jgi:hypothetical protein
MPRYLNTLRAISCHPVNKARIILAGNCGGLGKGILSDLDHNYRPCFSHPIHIETIASVWTDARNRTLRVSRERREGTFANHSLRSVCGSRKGSRRAIRGMRIIPGEVSALTVRAAPSAIERVIGPLAAEAVAATAPAMSARRALAVCAARQRSSGTKTISSV